MSFKMLYFAAAADYAKCAAELLPAPCTVKELFALLDKKYPGMADVLESSMLTVNLEYVDLLDEHGAQGATVIKEGDEVAVIPPVSAG
ncbi:molybdopterin synthase small subunit CnxG [Tricharina praecox]|uniref:molybdopterin synthase small subunit CnxG n=1 Tax=Tricharina praecox TaxID=43433 RepID=UPI00221E45BA|nr:molybdopterin synthase small subunit CnxG [Tricharina praecox]KAI5842781.1 molybdopterin synthase small subunit CnxG [Tricharina praecox]